jgi:IclR family pca regulon transcriptional regulator
MSDKSTAPPRAPTVPSTSAAKKAGADASSPERSSLFVNSVEKAMRVLSAFDATRRHLTLSQIATQTGMDMSTAQRFTYTLSTLGYLLKDEASKTYSLGVKLFDFTYNYIASNDLVYRATPYLQQLSRETEETTNITVLDGPDIVFVLRIVSRHVLNPTVIVGNRLPAYCTSAGLAMMSRMSREQVDALLDDTQLIAHTPNTVTDRAAIHERLARIRGNGYALASEEYYMGDISVAAAITDADGRPLGAINVAVTKPRWRGDEDEKRLSELVITAAGAVSGRR